jgi:molecular chaperone DnaK (HSP70)
VSIRRTLPADSTIESKDDQHMMKRTLAIGAFAILLSSGVESQGRAQYRDFQLGGDLASVSALAGIAASDAKAIHQRPALLQDLEWRPSRWLSGSSAVQTDPVQRIVFSFFNDQLFKVAVDYDQQRTEGLTDADMIESISEPYGPPAPAAKKKTTVTLADDTEFSTPVARWEGADYGVVLYRSSYTTAFRLIVTSPRLDALARTGEAQSLRLEAREAPQREIDRQKQEAERLRASQEKARLTNKVTFRP